MKCSYCGAEITSGSYCTYCGQYNDSTVNSFTIKEQEVKTEFEDKEFEYKDTHVKEEKGTLGILAIVFTFVYSLIGFILSIIGLCTYKEPRHRRKCLIALILNIVFTIIPILLAVLFLIIAILI